MSATPIQTTALLAGPILALLAAYLMSLGGFSYPSAITLGITVLCVVWWIFEPVPIPATSLLPLALLPLLGVLTPRDIAGAYGHPLILLLLGGFILSTALAGNGAHRRIALGMVRAFGGGSSRRLVFGFMAASGLLSMWISNTATTLMLLPVAMAIIDRSRDPDLAKPLLLGIAFAASIGGIGTPIGTPPNVIFMGVYQQQIGATITFADWMMWGVPIVLVFIPLAALWLTRRLTYRGQPDLPDPGPWRAAEVRVLIVFGITALLWITRQEPFGGWSTLLGTAHSDDYMVAFLAVAALFLIPNGEGGRLLDWATAEQIPWGMLILFGAGIAIAEAFVQSGLSTLLGDTLSGLSTLPILLTMLIICLTVTFMTEATSNTATATLLMPILAAAALGAGIDPRLLMVPAAMSASCAFMLPVATAPNVIAFSTGRFAIREMASEGFALNLIGVLVISIGCYLLIA
jgi:solute carrier family 13 (sodium-dependent dicarboxylate transporter), member 2/3/5